MKDFFFFKIDIKLNMYPLIRTSSIVKFYNELIASYLKLKFLKEIS